MTKRSDDDKNKDKRNQKQTNLNILYYILKNNLLLIYQCSDI